MKIFPAILLLSTAFGSMTAPAPEPAQILDRQLPKLTNICKASPALCTPIPSRPNLHTFDPKIIKLLETPIKSLNATQRQDLLSQKASLFGKANFFPSKTQDGRKTLQIFDESEYLASFIFPSKDGKTKGRVLLANGTEYDAEEFMKQAGEQKVEKRFMHLVVAGAIFLVVLCWD